MHQTYSLWINKKLLLKAAFKILWTCGESDPDYLHAMEA